MDGTVVAYHHPGAAKNNDAWEREMGERSGRI